MNIEDYRLPHEDDPGLEEHQSRFLGLLGESIRRLRPAALDLDEVATLLTDGRVEVFLPHASEPDFHLGMTMGRREATVSYYVEHEHFWPDDDTKGRSWPVTAADWVDAPVRFIEQFFLGRIELAVRTGYLFQSTKSYWINDEGEPELFLSGGTLLPSRRRTSRRLQFDFGARL